MSRKERRSRLTDILAGERGEKDRHAVRWRDLTEHPISQYLLGKTKETEEALDPNGSGFAASFEGLSVTKDVDDYVTALFQTTWTNPDGSGAPLAGMQGTLISPGSIATDRLIVGLQANDFINPDFLAALSPNWVAHDANGAAGSATVLSVNAAGSPYAWTRFPTLSAFQVDGATTGYFKFACKPVQDIAATLAEGWAVTPSERVSFSARVSAQRCTGSVGIEWFDGSGVSLGITNDAGDAEYVAGNLSTTSAGPVGSDSNPDLWDLVWIVADAPANAGYYLPVFRKGPSGSGDANSEMFVARPMHCRVHGEAVEPTPYSPPGSTLIDGATILTGSLTADKITVASLDALSANLGTIQVGTANIADAAIDSAKLSGTIQSDDFVAGNSGWQITKAGAAEFNSLVVRESNIQDGAVTARVTNTTNYSPRNSISSTNETIFNHTMLNSVASDEIEWLITVEIECNSMDVDLILECLLDSTLQKTDRFFSPGGATARQVYQGIMRSAGGGALLIRARVSGVNPVWVTKAEVRAKHIKK